MNMDAIFFPNVSITYRILLTIRVTIAFAEKKYFKFKNIKILLAINYVTIKIK